MGYELKLMVIRRSKSLGKEKIVLLGEEVFNAFNHDEDNDRYYYYPDGDSKTYVTDEPMIDSEPGLLLSIFELHKPGSGDGFGICSFKEADGHTCSVYTPFDGNKLVGLDSYGDYRKILTLSDTITRLEDIHPCYYAVTDALTYLRRLQKTFKDDSIACMFYGH
jgi:hypothetical protein